MGRHRAIGATVVALALALVTSACGDDGGATANENDNAAQPNLSGQTVEVVATWTGTEQANFQAVLDTFSRQTGATVRYTSGGNDLAVLLNSRVAGDSPPDVALIPQPGVVKEFINRGSIKELTGAAAAAVNANYADAWKQLSTVNGKLYGVYFKVANKSTIWYRADSFEQAGVQPPKSWEEFTTASKTLDNAGITPMAAAVGDGWVATDWFENVYLRVGGPDNYDKLAAHDLPWTDPTVVVALQILADYWRTPGFVFGGPPGAVQETFTQAIADVFGKDPKAAMLYEGDFVAAEINKLGQVKVGETARFFDWPSINGSPPAIVTAGDQAVAFKESPGAQALLAYLASPEAARIMAEKGGFLSANQKLDPAAYPDEITRQLATSVLNVDVLKFDLSDQTPQAFGGGTNASMWRLLQDFMSKDISPQQLAQQLEAAAQKDFG